MTDTLNRCREEFETAYSAMLKKECGNDDEECVKALDKTTDGNYYTKEATCSWEGWQLAWNHDRSEISLPKKERCIAEDQWAIDAFYEGYDKANADFKANGFLGLKPIIGGIRALLAATKPEREICSTCGELRSEEPTTCSNSFHAPAGTFQGEPKRESGERAKTKDLVNMIRMKLERRFQTADYMPDSYAEPHSCRGLVTDMCQDFMTHVREIHTLAERALNSIEDGSAS